MRTCKVPSSDMTFISRSSLISLETVAWVTSIPCSLSFSASSSWVSIGYFSMSSSIFACLVYFIVFKILSPEIDFCSEYVKEVDFPDLDKVDGIAGFPHADGIAVRYLVSLASVKETMALCSNSSATTALTTLSDFVMKDLE